MASPAHSTTSGRNTMARMCWLSQAAGRSPTAVGQVLGTSPETTIELNLRIRNSSVTEFAFTPKRHMLVTYNTLPHLDDASYKDWVTYS
jgi:hypothetical protein